MLMNALKEVIQTILIKTKFHIKYLKKIQAGIKDGRHKPKILS